MRRGFLKKVTSSPTGSSVSHAEPSVRPNPVPVSSQGVICHCAVLKPAAELERSRVIFIRGWGIAQKKLAPLGLPHHRIGLHLCCILLYPLDASYTASLTITSFSPSIL
jgi:hypothetical protein